VVDPDALEDRRGGRVFKAHRLLYHSTLGLRVIKKKKNLSEPRGNTVKCFKHFYPKAKALTVLYVPCSLDSGQ